MTAELVNIGDDEPMTLAEACERLGEGWSIRRLYRAIADGRLVAEKIGRQFLVTPAYLDAMLASNAPAQTRPASLPFERSFLGVEGNIYFIGFGEYLKIGYTAGDVAKRVRSLSTGCPEPLSIYATIRGIPEAEKALHARFASLRLQGEWFRYEGDLRAYVEALPK